MRLFVMVLNLIIVIFFSVAFAYTFIARDHIDGLAKEFVTTKTVEYAKTVAPVLDEILKSPLTDKILAVDQKASIKTELNAFNEDPITYVVDLTQEKTLPVPKKINPLVDKIASLKQKIRDYYQDTLNELVLDLRIFTGSNLIAGILGLFNAVYSWYSQRELGNMALILSIMMLASIFLCTYVYIDDMSFFTIITRSYFGWGYPVFLMLILFGMFYDYWRTTSDIIDQLDGRETSNPFEIGLSEH